GVLLARASARRPVSTFSAVDLPAFERPAIATSSPSSAGNWAALAALSKRWASEYMAQRAFSTRPAGVRAGASRRWCTILCLSATTILARQEIAVHALDDTLARVVHDHRHCLGRSA